MWPVDEERNKLTYEDYYKMAVEALDAHEADTGRAGRTGVQKSHE